MKNIFPLLFLFFALSLPAQNKPCGDEPSFSVEGELTNSSSSFPEMLMMENGAVRPGQKGELSKYFETKIFNANMSGWLVIGEVEVVSVKGKTVRFKVKEKKSEMTINGQPKNHFEKGRRVKFAVYEYAEPVIDSAVWESTGKLRYKGTVYCGKKTGTWTYWYPNGQIENQFTLDSISRKQGKYTEYNEEGRVVTLANYRNDKLHGLNETFYANGVKRSEATYTEGRLEGTYTEWFDNGNTMKQEHYRMGRKDGSSAEYFENGKMRSEFTWKDDQKTGAYKLYNEAGVLLESGNLLRGDKEGLTEYFFPSGQKMAEKNYSSGKLNGAYKTWFANGQPHESGYYAYGKKDKDWTIYYENGKIKESSNWSNGEWNGAYAEYYGNGQLKTKGSYVSGKEEGQWEAWYENGKPKYTGNYSSGMKTGKWTSWDEQGKKKKEKY